MMRAAKESEKIKATTRTTTSLLLLSIIIMNKNGSAANRHTINLVTVTVIHLVYDGYH